MRSSPLNLPTNSGTLRLDGWIAHFSPFCAAGCHPVHYENWFGRRPGPGWESSVMWCRLTHWTSLPLLTVGALVDSGSLPHSLQLPRYHLTVFWQRAEPRGMWKRRNNCLQAMCWESSPTACYCSLIFLIFFYGALLHRPFACQRFLAA